MRSKRNIREHNSDLADWRWSLIGGIHAAFDAGLTKRELADWLGFVLDRIFDLRMREDGDWSPDAVEGHRLNAASIARHEEAEEALAEKRLRRSMDRRRRRRNRSA